MKIGLNTTFKFGKHKGKDFKWILLNDLSYLRFLFRKGFYFEHNCVHLITKEFDIIEDITVNVKSSKDEVLFFEERYIILYPEKGIRKKTLRINLCKNFLKKASLKNIPFEMKEKIVEKEHYDSSAFQSDDRFFTTSEILKTKVYDKDEIEKMDMGAFLAVAKGSSQDPKFIHIQYNPFVW